MRTEILRVQAELGGEGSGYQLVGLRTVVLHVPEQGGLGDDQQAGGDEPLVPPRLQSRHRVGERVVQFAEDRSG